MADKNSFLDKCLTIHSLLLQHGVNSGISFKQNESKCIITVNNKSMTFSAGDEIDTDKAVSALEKF